MPVSLIQFRSEIGVFYSRIAGRLLKYKFSITVCLCILLMNCISLIFLALKGVQMLFYKSIVYGLSCRNFASIFQYHYLILQLIDISYFRLLILLSGDVQLNPGPSHNSFHSFSISALESQFDFFK